MTNFVRSYNRLLQYAGKPRVTGSLAGAVMLRVSVFNNWEAAYRLQILLVLPPLHRACWGDPIIVAH